MKRYASSVFNGRTEDLEYITFICDLHFMVLATRVRRYVRIIDMQNSSSLDLKHYANPDYRSLLKWICRYVQITWVYRYMQITGVCRYMQKTGVCRYMQEVGIGVCRYIQTIGSWSLWIHTDG